MESREYSCEGSLKKERERKERSKLTTLDCALKWVRRSGRK